MRRLLAGGVALLVVALGLPAAPALLNDRSVGAAARQLRQRAGAAAVVGEERRVGSSGSANGCEGEVLLGLRDPAPGEIAALAGTTHEVFCAAGGLSWWRSGECLRMERFGAAWSVPDAPVDLGLDPSEHDALRAFAARTGATHLVRRRFRLPAWRDLDLRCH